MRYTLKGDPEVSFYAYCEVPVWPKRWFDGTINIRRCGSLRIHYLLKAAYPNLFGDIASPSLGVGYSSFGTRLEGNPFPVLREMMERIGAVTDDDLDAEERETRADAVTEARQEALLTLRCLHQTLTIKSLHRSSSTEVVEVSRRHSENLMLYVDETLLNVGAAKGISEAIRRDVPEAVWDGAVRRMLTDVEEIVAALRSYTGGSEP